MKKWISLLTLSYGLVGFAAEPFVLNESVVLKLINDNPPSMQNIEADYLNSKLQKLSGKDLYAPVLTFEGSDLNSNERLLTGFNFATFNARTYKMSLAKPLKHGVKVSLDTYSEKISNNFLQDASLTSYGVNISLDLYKDIFGRLSKAKLAVEDLAQKSGEIEKKIKVKSFSTQVRKLYWALVANQEQQKFTEKLLESAQKQLVDSKRRFREKVADAGEVARNQSNVSSRTAVLTGLKYIHSDIVRQLKTLFPKISDKEIVLDNYNVKEAVDNVMLCSAKIKFHSGIPYEYTDYDELISLLKEMEAKQRVLDKSYDKADIKLMGRFEQLGKGFGINQAYQDFQDDSRERVSFGLSLSVPLGGSKGDSREVKQLIQKKKYQAKRDEIDAKLVSFHTQTLQSINYLRTVYQAQQDNNKYLNQSLRVSRKKFNQARINIQQYIQEQDVYFQSSLDEIDTKLRVINTLLDYFSVFNEFPCKLNQKEGV